MAEDNFLRRWSRRKHESVRDERAPQPAPPVLPRAERAAPAAPAAAKELPSIESLRGLASDYKEFLDPAVDENLRRSALKKLFQDPHFNVMDGLDVYIDDYSKPDPVPESMLKELLARHRAFGDAADDEAKQAGEPAAEPPIAVADDTQPRSVPGPESTAREAPPSEEKPS